MLMARRRRESNLEEVDGGEDVVREQQHEQQYTAIARSLDAQLEEVIQ